MLNFLPLNAGWFRSCIADYGVPLMVLVWSALSFSVPGTVPSGVPRMLVSPLPWESASLQHWTVIKVKVPVFSWRPYTCVWLLTKSCL